MVCEPLWQQERRTAMSSVGVGQRTHTAAYEMMGAIHSLRRTRLPAAFLLVSRLHIRHHLCIFREVFTEGQRCNHVTGSVDGHGHNVVVVFRSTKKAVSDTAFLITHNKTAVGRAADANAVLVFTGSAPKSSVRAICCISVLDSSRRGRRSDSAGASD